MPRSHKSQQEVKKWLDKLQQESWQLELLVSGFAIFLVLNARDPIFLLINKLSALQVGEGNTFFILFLGGLLGLCWFVLITNLLLHVTFRGLWISVVGLRYVSGDINYRNFKLQPRFEQFLRRRLRSFDDYILFLEKLCSLIFAFTFLLIFISGSFISYFFFANGVELFLDATWDQSGLSYAELISDIFSYVLIAAGILYFIDFLTLSRLKRIRWLTPIYYPFYRLMGWLTLARFYRPLYYNLIDDRFGRNFALALLPYLALCLVLSLTRYEFYTFLPTQKSAYLEDIYYEDSYEEDNYFEVVPSIPSRHLAGNFLEVFVPYLPLRDNPALREQCPGLPEIRKEGLTLGGSTRTKTAQPIDSLLACMGSLHQLYVNDSLLHTDHYYFYQHPRRNNQGVLFLLDLAYLPHGVHSLRIESPPLLEDSPVQISRLQAAFVEIVFYKD